MGRARVAKIPGASLTGQNGVLTLTTRALRATRGHASFNEGPRCCIPAAPDWFTVPVNPGLVAHIADVGRTFSADPSAEPVVLALRREVVVVRLGDVVVKAHLPGADGTLLSARLRLAAEPAVRGVLLAPLSPAVTEVDGRLVTTWPLGEPVDPDRPAAVPWERAAELLAELHLVDVTSFAQAPPAAGGLGRFARTITELRGTDGAAAAVVLRAFDSLAPLTPHRVSLTHGDWHLGQLVTTDHGWRLIDVDDVGTGDPAWDLARLAALHAVGVLDPAVWSRFLQAYRAAGGPAVPRTGDPWPALDLPARALVVQMAARALLTARRTGVELADEEKALVDTCERIAKIHRPITHD
jgi:hypothetical protein